MIPPDGHGTKRAGPILAVPNEEMEIDLKGGNFEWKTFPSPFFPTWVLLKSVKQLSDSTVGEQDFKWKILF